MSKNKEDTGPRLSSVIIAGMLAFALGKTLAIASLISEPATLLNTEPDPEAIKPGIVWYVRGERAGRTAWQPKEEGWRAGRVNQLALSEAELNQWSQDRTKVERPAVKPEEAGWADKLRLDVTPVAFRLLDGRLQMTTEVSLPGLLEGRSFLYAVVGEFESTPRGVRFVPERGTLGSAPIGSVPFYREWLFGYMRKQFEAGADLAWLEEDFGQLEAVEVTDGQLVLRRRAQG